MVLGDGDLVMTKCCDVCHHDASAILMCCVDFERTHLRSPKALPYSKSLFDDVV